MFINNTLAFVAGGGAGYDNTGGPDQGGRASNDGGLGPNGACAGPAAATGGAGGSGGGCNANEGGGGGINSSGGFSTFPQGGGGGGAADLTPGDGLAVAAGGTAGTSSGTGRVGGRGFTGGGGADRRESGGGGGYSGGNGGNGGGGSGEGGSFIDGSAADPDLANGADNPDSGDGLVRIEYSTLELIKAVTNDGAGTSAPADFTLRLSSTDGVFDGSTAFTSGNVVPITSDGSSVTYTMSEDAFAGYTEESNSCSALVHTISDIGTDYVCTIVNNDATPIDAVDDTPAAIASVTGGTVPNVVTNDSLNGVTNPAIGTEVTINEAGTAQDGFTPLGLDVIPVAGGITLDPNSGEVTVDPGTTSGTYVYTYEICEVGNATNCDTATVTILVGDGLPVATNDTVTPTAPGPVTINPLANDTGTDPLDPTTVVLTGTGAPGGSTLSPDGKTLTVPGQGEWSVDPTTGLVTFTPEPGFTGSPTPAAYVVSDTMGRTSNEALLSLTVLASVITATNDPAQSVDSASGGTTPVSVLDNDTLNGSPITNPALVALTPVSLPSPAAGSVSLNPDGTITVAPGTTPGTYTIDYQICEVGNLANCATAQAQVIVLGAGTLIPAIEDDLKAILEEDLANTLVTQSRQIGGYAADASDRLRGRSHDRCLADVNARLAVTKILFDTDRAVIKTASSRTLDELATILGTCPGSAFEIAGHTDSDASDAYNLDLSQRRVAAVLGALTARGVDTAGFVARGYGEREPIASNATAAGKAQNRRVEFRALDGSDAYQGPCEGDQNLVRGFDLSANDDGVTADGQFLRDDHDCVTDRREVFEASLSYTDTSEGQTQNVINLSYRREQYRGSESVFGYFIGLYGSQSDVTSRAIGDISGVGLNAGVYGAKLLQQDMILDYYLGAAVGRHEFDLDFDRGGSTISASGDYSYYAGFAGPRCLESWNMGTPP